MKLYLAGPMTGIEDLNFPKFHALTAALRDLGFEIVNPAEVNSDPSSEWLDCMRKDISELMACDGVAAMDGWRNSRGACIEVCLARVLGLPVFDAEVISKTKLQK